MKKEKKKEVKPFRGEDLCKWIQDGEHYACVLLIRQNLKNMRMVNCTAKMPVTSVILQTAGTAPP